MGGIGTEGQRHVGEVVLWDQLTHLTCFGVSMRFVGNIDVDDQNPYPLKMITDLGLHIQLYNEIWSLHLIHLKYHEQWAWVILDVFLFRCHLEHFKFSLWWNDLVWLIQSEPAGSRCCFSAEMLAIWWQTDWMGNEYQHVLCCSFHSMLLSLFLPLSYTHTLSVSPDLTSLLW